MVCTKTPETEHDFATDPIQPVIAGDWLQARGTTLGADNGLGLAGILAILEVRCFAVFPVRFLRLGFTDTYTLDPPPGSCTDPRPSARSDHCG